MTYEFAPNEVGFDSSRPTAPDFWRNRVNRIYKLPPNEPTWVSYFSVIQDPHTGVFGIDTHDQLQYYPKNKPFNANATPVGLMRAWFEHEGEQVDGFFIDLRYASNMPERELVFEPGDDNEHMTVSVIGALLQEDGRVHFRSPYHEVPQARDAAISMMMYFDADYAERYGAASLSEGEVARDSPSLDDVSNEGR